MKQSTVMVLDLLYDILSSLENHPDVQTDSFQKRIHSLESQIEKVIPKDSRQDLDLLLWMVWCHKVHGWSFDYAYDEGNRWKDGVRDHLISDVTCVHAKDFFKF